MLDIGSSNAFFTFLSKRARGRFFYLIYFLWLIFQFFVTLTILWLIIPSNLLDRIWLGQNQETILLAFVAVFLQQQVWPTVGQIGEAFRKTVKVQLMNLSVAVLYFVVIFCVSIFSQLSVEKILLLIIGQYIVATILAYFFLKNDVLFDYNVESSFSEIIGDYWKYCKPLLILAFAHFAYDFADKWMLQKYGGASQQGYFQIASQFAGVSLLATASILSIFWKEIADAWENKNKSRVLMLYHKVSRGLVMLGVIISGLLIPWSEQIVNVFLGSAYEEAWPVLAIMLLYPIHQSMGQIGGAMLLASGQTYKFMFVSVVFMIVSIPATYFVLAPSSTTLLSGMQLGAVGLAYKMVLLNIVSVNTQAWIIAKYNGWKFDWVFQLVGIPMMIASGFIAKYLVELLWDTSKVNISELLIPVSISSFLYSLISLSVIWRLPWLIGSSHAEIKAAFIHAKKIILKLRRDII